MKLIKSLGNSKSLFLCEHCNKEVEKRTDTGKASNSCGSIECNRKQRIKKNWELYPNSIMKVIEDIGFVENNRGQAQHLVKYECPHCTKHVDIVINRGFKQQSCGSRECQNKALKVSNKTEKLQEVGGTHIQQFKSVWSGMKARCYNKNDKSFHLYGGKGIEIEWNDVDEFKRDMFEEYKTARQNWIENGSINRLKPEIDREDSDKNYSKENCRWITKSENAARKNDEYKPVYQINKNTMEILYEWNSARDAAKIVSDILYVDKIKSVCNGLRNEHQGFIWRWKDEYDATVAQSNDNHLYGFWSANVAVDCSKAWKSFETFIEQVGTTGEQLIRVNINEPWSASNFRWESADYVRKDMGKKNVEKIDKSSNQVIATYKSIKDAVEDTEGSGQANISACCSGKRKSHAGFKWRFAA